MEKNINQEDDVRNIEYRIAMEAELARDFWFMCIRIPDAYEVDFDWNDICINMEWGNGWLREFYNLCSNIVTEVKSDFHWVQLKEKFGRACCYYTGSITPYGAELIREFEKESETICEHCGEPGKLRGTGWYMTLCDKCWEECRK